MKRLTWTCRADGYDDVGLRDGVTVGDAICRLAEYENTWLEPEEITDLQQTWDMYGGEEGIMALLAPPNEPLTLEELREMDGEPVYVKYPNGEGEYGLVETMCGHGDISIRFKNWMADIVGMGGLFSRITKIYRYKTKVMDDETN